MLLTWISTKFKHLSFPQNIKLAEDWAKRNGLLFPPIDADEQFDRDGWKECYVFKDPTNPECPIILHFVLVNKTYRDFVRPGQKLKLAVTRSLFFPCWRQFAWFYFAPSSASFNDLLRLLIGHCDNFGFGLTTLNKNAL